MNKANHEELSLSASQKERQNIFSILSKSDLNDIQQLWKRPIDSFDYKFIRKPETGMVMAVARTGMTGEPFNLGEVTVTRCAIKLSSGENGYGYVRGRNSDHAVYIAVIDALAQTNDFSNEIYTELLYPLQKINQEKTLKQQQQANKSKVDFFTMVRGEDDE